MEWLDLVSNLVYKALKTVKTYLAIFHLIIFFLVIGRGGEQISRIQQESGCKIQIAPGNVIFILNRKLAYFFKFLVKIMVCVNLFLALNFFCLFVLYCRQWWPSRKVLYVNWNTWVCPVSIKIMCLRPAPFFLLKGIAFTIEPTSSCTVNFPFFSR